MQELKIKKLSLTNFKNYDSLELEFSNDIVCFAGNNGMGKTNLLDAIYYLSFCKSFINNSDVQNIRNSEAFFSIFSNIDISNNSENFHCAYKRDERKVYKRNKIEYQKLANHIGVLPLVLISPSDVFLIHDGSETRRKFLDGIISQFDSNYLHNLLQYNKALVQRNTLLKQFAESGMVEMESLEIWNSQLADYGHKIYNSRSSFINDFISNFQYIYHLLAPVKENIKLVYESHLNSNKYEELLAQNLNKDLMLKYTTHGIHKDDLLFLLNDNSLKKIASQGQQKTYLTALKLAQYQYIARIKNLKPILLIDDIYDKLDPLRVKHLLELVINNNFGQIFITDTNPERIIKVFDDIRHPFQLFNVENGEVNPIN